MPRCHAVSMSTDTIIRVDGVSKKFCRSLKRTIFYGMRDVARDVFGISQSFNGLRPDEFWALNDISFEVRRGECLGLVGPNGAGKTTLLKLLNGITLPDKGRIKVAGRVGALLELGAGFHPMLTGRENIYLSGAILGLGKDEIAKKFDAIVDFAGLEEFIDSPVNHYSSGMYVRLGFAIAAHAEPDVFLIDEALAVGDLLFQSKCYAKLREFRDRGTTIIFVTHSLDLVASQCSRALLINKGTRMALGTPKDVIDQYNRLMFQRRVSTNPPVENGAVEVNALSSSRKAEWTELFTVNPTEDRYGSRKAEILEAGIFTLGHDPVQVLERNREFLIKIKVRHNVAMPAAISAYSVRDLKGTVLCGTNTLYQNIDMGQVQIGTVVLVVFRQVARLNPGDYLLSIGCGAWEAGEYVIYDRRFDYLPFQVVGKAARIGVFDPESVVEWKRLD
jgi:teichoic acid transport system ATP-binding protein